MENPATRRFGRYEILCELGRGAMGVVYKARDPQIDRLVAVKTVSLLGQDKEAEREFRMRFQNEAQAAGRLHHPGIVSVFDVGEDPETCDPYIVLEYVAGEALNRVLARERKLALPRALQLAEEIARALDYAHEQGVTHRDIKPGNIMITHDGHAKIADFGIAKLNLAHFTLPGKLLGTPAYMAPEQLAGEGSDGRSDLFSLGVILYAIVTGHSPFQGDSATTVCFKVANREPVPASALDLNLPRDLDAVIAKAMAKDPKGRYQRGVEFADALATLRTRSTPGMTTRSGMVVATRANKIGAVLNGRPAMGFAYAWKLIRITVSHVRVRDLTIGLATIVVLAVLGVHSTLLVHSRKEVTQVAGAIPAHAVPSPDIAAVTTGPAGESTPDPAAAVRPKAITEAKNPPTSLNVKAARSAEPAGHVAMREGVALTTIDFAIRHQFKEATLFVWIDGKLVLTRPLHGGMQKRLVVFGGVRGTESETLRVPEGVHEIRLRAQSEDHTVDLSKTISTKLTGGEQKTLQISFDKHNTAMHLEWQ